MSRLSPCALLACLLCAAPAQAQARKQQPVHETLAGLLEQAREHKLLGRVAGKRYFRSRDEAWMVDLRSARDGGVMLRWTVLGESGSIARTTCRISAKGRLARYEYTEGQRGDAAPRRSATGTQKTLGVIELETRGFPGKAKRKVPWPDDAVPTPVVLFLIAPLYDYVPGGGRRYRLLTGLELEKKGLPSYFDPNHEERRTSRVMKLGERYELEVDVSPPAQRGRVAVIAPRRQDKLLSATEKEVERFFNRGPGHTALRPKPSPTPRPTPSRSPRPRPTPSRPPIEPLPTGPAQIFDAKIEADGIKGLKGIRELQLLFREGDKDKNGELDYAPDLATLVKALELPGSLATSSSTTHYRYALVRSKTQPEFKWMGVATPRGKRGRHLAIDFKGKIVASPRPIALDPAGVVPSKGVAVVVAGRASKSAPAPAGSGKPSAAKMRENEAVADIHLTAIYRLQIVYSLKDKDKNGQRDYAPDLASLMQASDATNDLRRIGKTGVAFGYRFRMLRSASEPTRKYLCVAEPVEPGKTGEVWLAINHEGRAQRSKKGPFALDPGCEIKPKK